jgi:hypothetical protein
MLISLEYGEWENQESRLRVYIWAKLKPALLLTSDPDTNDRRVHRLLVHSELPCDERKRLQEDCDRLVFPATFFLWLDLAIHQPLCHLGPISIQVRLRPV